MKTKKRNRLPKRKSKYLCFAFLCRYNKYIYTYNIFFHTRLQMETYKNKYIFPAIACDQKFKFFFPAFYQYSRFYVGYFFVIILSTRSKQKTATTKRIQMI